MSYLGQDGQLKAKDGQQLKAKLLKVAKKAEQAEKKTKAPEPSATTSYDHRLTGEEQIKLAQQRQEMQAQQLAAQIESTRALVDSQANFMQSVRARPAVATGVPYQAKLDWMAPIVVLVSLLGMAAIGGGFLYLVKSHGRKH